MLEKIILMIVYSNHLHDEDNAVTKIDNGLHFLGNAEQ